MTNRIAWIAPLVIGIASFLLLMREHSRLERSARGGPRVPVLVAARDLDAGEHVDASMLLRVDMPASFVEERHLRLEMLERVAGLPLAFPMRSGEALMWRDLLGAEQAETLSTLIPSVHRALTLEVQGISAHTEPGDRIDLLLRARGAEDGQVRPLAQNLLVLAVGSRHQRGQEREFGSIDSRLTISVAPQDAQLLTLARSKGELHMLLRHPGDSVVSRRDPGLTERELESLLGAAERRPRGAGVGRASVVGKEIEHVD